MSSDRRLFHLSLPMPFDLALKSGRECFEPPSFSEEGFVHLSFAEQLRGTLNAHFATANELYLLELDPAALVEHLKLEPSRGGALFPHHFAGLPWHGFLRRWLLRRRAAGFEVPYLDNQPELDIPPGDPFTR